MVFHSFAVRNTAAYARALFNPPEGVMQEWELIAQLTARLNGANRIGPSPEQMLQAVLANGYHPEVTVEAMLEAGTGIDLGPLQPSLPDRLETPDQRIHLAPQVYLDDLPRLLSHADSRDVTFPFAMIGRRQVRSHNSWTQNSHRLVKGRNRCTVEINPVDADRLGVNEGADVVVSSRVGAVTLPAEITETMAPGVVSIPQGWGQSGDTIKVAAEAGTVSINDLTDDARIAPLSGNAAFNGVPVQISLAG
jgi:anaerobic selenocysteine-containing dehydrogenase